MKILFLTLVKVKSLDERGIYSDLLRKFRDEGSEVFVLSPLERREQKATYVVKEKEATLVNVRTFNLQKTNSFEKGIGTLAIEYQYLQAIQKYFSNIKFDLILYSTPPITFSKVIEFVKKRDNAYSYLLLKDIFPQNAVDMKMIKEGGLLHKMFLSKERRLYELSDAIGCMSEANKKYLITHNPTLNPQKIEVNPNSISPIQITHSLEDKIAIKEKYAIPLNKKIFVYGGNLGKPQGIDFLIETIRSNTNQNVFFLIVGSGTEYNRIQSWFQSQGPKNAKLMEGLPKYDYDILLSACDVGMIFLNKDFSIPNFPSRLLSYLELKKPVIAATDAVTDIGIAIEKNKCGYSILSGDLSLMQKRIDEICTNEDMYHLMSENAWHYLQREFKVEYSYQLINDRLPNV